MTELPCWMNLPACWISLSVLVSIALASSVKCGFAFEFCPRQSGGHRHFFAKTLLERLQDPIFENEVGCYEPRPGAGHPGAKAAFRAICPNGSICTSGS